MDAPVHFNERLRWKVVRGFPLNCWRNSLFYVCLNLDMNYIVHVESFKGFPFFGILIFSSIIFFFKWQMANTQTYVILQFPAAWNTVPIRFFLHFQLQNCVRYQVISLPVGKNWRWIEISFNVLKKSLTTVWD